LYIFKNIFKSTTSIIDNIGCCLLIESPKWK
jgi:hypothetical protein